MTDNEHLKQQAEIIKEHGEAIWDDGLPVNESARKLKALKYARIKEKAEAAKLEELVKDFKEINVPSVAPLPVPDHIIKESWLSPFTEEQRKMLVQWVENVSQTKEEIATAVGSTAKAVKALMRSDAFKHFVKNIELAHKQLLPLIASIRLGQLLKSKDEKIASQAAKLVLLDSGLYKGDSIDVTNIKPTEIVIDEALQEKLRRMAQNMRDNKTKDVE